MENNYDSTILDKWLAHFKPGTPEYYISMKSPEHQMLICDQEIVGYKVKKHRFRIVNFWRKLTKTEVQEPIYNYTFKYTLPYGE